MEADAILRSILVVDDEEEYRMLVKQALASWGYACGVASDGFEAMRKLQTGEFDLVISDMKMPGKDGLEAIREAQKAFPDVDFMIMTGYTDEYSYSDIVAAGAVDYLTKPFETGKLKSKLERLEREKQTIRRLEQANRALSWEAGINASVAALSQALLGSRSLEEISHTVLDHARELTGSPEGFVGYIDQETGRFATPAVTPGITVDCAHSEGAAVSGGPAGSGDWVLEHGESLLTNDPRDDSHFSGRPADNLPLHRFLSAPARMGDIILGQIALANSSRDYTEEDRGLMERLAGIYALAVQRKWVLDELHQAKDLLENVFENAAEAIGIVDEHGRFVKWNKAAEQLYGYSFEELRGKKFSEVYASKKDLGEMLTQLRRDGYVYGYEIASRRKDGQVLPFRVSIRVLRSPEGQIVGSVAVATDLSDIKNALVQLKDANEQLLVQIAQRERLAEELREARDALEKLVVERTERLSKAQGILKRSIERFKEIDRECVFCTIP